MRLFRRIQQRLNWSRRHYFGVIGAVILLAYLSSAAYQSHKPLPEGLNFTGPLRHADVQFLADQTYLDHQGQQQHDQHIFNAIFQLIEQAQSTIVLDMFLFNAEVGKSTLHYRPLMQQLTDALIAKRRQNPQIEIKLITDPINSVYGGLNPEHYRTLRQAGIDVIETDLTPLRASNPLWSGFWYLCCQDVGNHPAKGWLPNPFGTHPITLRSYLHLFNFKANHRKTIVVDTVEGWKTLVTSANPHDGSSLHSNVALLVSGHTAVDVLNTERAVAAFSGADMPAVIVGHVPENPTLPQVQVLTEAAIYQAVLNLLDHAQTGEQVDVAMFYLSERRVIAALKQAHERGVKLRILLDPNKDAFGRQKNGIPNRQVASELHASGIAVRWCNTHGEQCHNKMLLKHGKTENELILGSANLTARNLKNYNLETNLRVLGSAQAAVFVDAGANFETAWSNLHGRFISVDYAQYADESKLKYWLYRFTEWSGLSTF